MLSPTCYANKLYDACSDTNRSFLLHLKKSWEESSIGHPVRRIFLLALIPTFEAFNRGVHRFPWPVRALVSASLAGVAAAIHLVLHIQDPLDRIESRLKEGELNYKREMRQDGVVFLNVLNGEEKLSISSKPVILVSADPSVAKLMGEMTYQDAKWKFAEYERSGVFLLEKVGNDAAPISIDLACCVARLFSSFSLIDILHSYSSDSSLSCKYNSIEKKLTITVQGKELIIEESEGQLSVLAHSELTAYLAKLMRDREWSFSVEDIGGSMHSLIRDSDDLSACPIDLVKEIIDKLRNVPESLVLGGTREVPQNLFIQRLQGELARSGIPVNQSDVDLHQTINIVANDWLSRVVYGDFKRADGKFPYMAIPVAWGEKEADSGGHLLFININDGIEYKTLMYYSSTLHSRNAEAKSFQVSGLRVRPYNSREDTPLALDIPRGIQIAMSTHDYALCVFEEVVGGGCKPFILDMASLSVFSKSLLNKATGVDLPFTYRGDREDNK